MRDKVWFGPAAAVAVALSIGAGGASALCPQNINVQVGDRTIDFEYETDVPGVGTRYRVAYGLTAGDWSFRSRPLPANNATRATRFVPLTGLAPSTTYYLDPQVSTVGQTEWSDAASCQAQICPSAGAQPGGYTCEDVGGGQLLARVTTLPLDEPLQRLPAPPTHDIDPSIIPAVTGSTFTIEVDEEGLCTNFQAQLTACGAADPNLTHQILIPSGATCRPESENRTGYDLPAKSGSGVCIVRTDADPLLLPPPGVRADPAFRAHMAKIETNRVIQSMDNDALLAAPSCGAPPCTEGWRFEALALQHPPHEQRERNRLEIVSVNTSTGVITVSAPHGFSFFDLVQVNAPGIHDRDFHRGCRVSTQPTATTFRCFGKEGGLGGSYTGGGYVTEAVSVPLTGCSAGTPSICTTAEPHGFGNFHAFSIISLSNGALTTATPHLLPSGVAVKVEGTPGGAWDGIFQINSANGSSGTLVNAPSGVCNPCAGTVRQLGMLNIGEVRGLDEASVNRTHLFTVLDGTRILLELSSASGALTGGYVSYDPTAADPLLALADGRRVVFDRCVIDLRGAPYRTTSVFGWTTQNAPFRTSSAVINTWIREANTWFGSNPVTRTAVDTGLSVFSTAGFAHVIHRTRDLQLRNNMLESILGIGVFADVNIESPHDISVVRNVFWTPERFIGGREEARGRYYISRHHLELKAGVNVAVRGNYYRGNPANGQPSGVAVALALANAVSGEGNDRTLRDIAIDYNTFYKNGGFIDMVGSSEGTSDTKSAQRIRIAHNLAVEVDSVRYRTFPAGQTGTQPNGWPLTISPYSGRFFLAYSEFEDLRLERNTILPTLGSGPHVWLATTEGSGGLVVANNILPFSRSTLFQYGLRGDTSGTGYVPPPASSSGYAFWKDHYRQGPGISDPLALWDNLLLPCTDASDDLSRDAALMRVNSMASLATAHLACAGGCPSNFTNQIPFSDGQHCKDREQQLFAAETGYRLPAGSPYSAYGADIDAIRAVQGRVYDVQVAATPISATITYQAPDSAACFVDYGPDKMFSTPAHTRVSDGGGSTQRSVVLPGLESLTTYHYRVLCQSDQPRGVFLTPPGGPV